MQELIVLIHFKLYCYAVLYPHTSRDGELDFDALLRLPQFTSSPNGGHDMVWKGGNRQ